MVLRPHELDLDRECLEIVGRQLVFDAGRDGQLRGQIQVMQSHENVDRGGVAFLDRRRRIAGDDAVGAEIFDEEKAGLDIGGENLGRAESTLAQRPR